MVRPLVTGASSLRFLKTCYNRKILVQFLVDYGPSYVQASAATAAHIPKVPQVRASQPAVLGPLEIRKLYLRGPRIE